MFNPLKQVTINWQAVNNYRNCLNNPNQTLFDFFYLIIYLFHKKKISLPSLGEIEGEGRALLLQILLE
jgi:hypothetical protein